MSAAQYSIEDVFQPTSFPQHTYVDRAIAEGETYELRLKKALRSLGRLISITGLSKAGKTVLCHKAIESTRIVDLSGAQIQTQTDFWNQIAEKIGLPAETQVTTNTSDKVSAGIKFAAQAGVEHTTGQNQMEKTLRGNNAIMEYLRENGKILVLDDFHYIPDELQMYIARILKTELFNGLKAIIISLPHRADDAIRHNPDLIGRTTFIEIAPWSLEELAEIGRTGFGLLHYRITADDLQLLARESVASPQLMQENCLNLAYRANSAELRHITTELVKVSFADTALNYSFYNNILQEVLHGPAQGRNKRSLYSFKDGRTEDIYHLLLTAISIDPPVLSMHVDEIKGRCAELVETADRNVTTLLISNTVSHIENIIKESLPKVDTLEWRNKTLYIIDPFLLFYLRWSGIRF